MSQLASVTVSVSRMVTLALLPLVLVTVIVSVDLSRALGDRQGDVVLWSIVCEVNLYFIYHFQRHLVLGVMMTIMPSHDDSISSWPRCHHDIKSSWSLGHRHDDDDDDDDDSDYNDYDDDIDDDDYDDNNDEDEDGD